MSTLNIKRVSALPAIKSASTLYIVAATDPSLVELYFTGNDETTVRRIQTKADIQSMIDISVGAATQSTPKLTTARDISITGDATWTVSFDGSGNVSGAMTLTELGSLAGNYGISTGKFVALTVNNKGQVTSISEQDITSLEFLTGDIKTPSSILFKTNGTYTHTTGKLQWNESYKTLSLGLNNGLSVNLGQDIVTLAVNTSGVDIYKGEVVYVVGAIGTAVTIAKAQANSINTSKSTYGIAIEDIPNAGTGFVKSSGIVENVNTSSFILGDTLFLSADTPGQLTKTKPTKPNLGIIVGYVSAVHLSQGKIAVKVSYVGPISNSPDVNLNSLTDKDLLTYESSTGLWKNKSISTLGLLTVNDKAVPNGLATLDGNGLIPSNQLPSFVDDVLEYVNLAGFPVTGVQSKIYVALDTGAIYRWSGSVYIEISATAGTVDAATKLATARTLSMTGDGTWSVNFDGTSNVSSVFTLSNTGIPAGEYIVVTYDTKGRALNFRSLLDSDIPSLPGSKISSQISVNTTGNAGTATKLATPRNINGVAFDGSANITINAVDSTARIASSEKGAVNGVATLDSNGTIPSNQLPSFVDDVLEYVNLAGFPGTGSTGKIYLALDTGKIYRWSGSVYIEISATAGTADAATKLATARTIAMTGDGSWSVSFDGTANVTSTFTLSNTITPGEYIVVTYDSKGRAVNTRALAATDIPSLPGTKINSDISVNTTGNSATSTKLQTPRNINGVAFDGSANITISAVDSTARIASSEKGAANGVATLDASGLIPTNQLPSFVDDVLEYANLAGFPGSGSTGKIYVALDTGKIYRWSGTVYVEISPTAGTADAAIKLATARTIALSGEATATGTFDGTANLTLNVTLRAATTSLSGSMSSSDKTKLDGIETGAKVNSLAYNVLPGVLVPSTVYFVKNGPGLDIYLSNDAGTNATIIPLGGSSSSEIDSFLFFNKD